jgi:cell division protease FtsH
MVMQYGMSSNVGSVAYGQAGEVFIGRDMAHTKEYSEVTAQAIDKEIRAILDAAHDEAYKAINLNRRVLDSMAKELMERETLNAEDIAVIFKTVKKVPRRPQWLSKKTRPKPKLGPIAIPAKGSTASKKAASKVAATTKKPAPKRAPRAKKA